MNSPWPLISLLTFLGILQGVLCTVEYTVVDDNFLGSHIVNVRDRRQITNSTSSPNSSTEATSSLSSSPSTTLAQLTVDDGSTINTITLKPDTKDYYEVSYAGADRWVTLNADDPDVVSHVSLQDAHRLAVKLPLKFDFLFYGHTVSSVTIATGGFLYMSEFLHSFLTASQYIAPLMANFDTAIGNNSEILYKSTETLFVCEWRNVVLKDQQSFGPYTFQAQLYKDRGNIILAYTQVPRSPDEISTLLHPVKVGLSDAFYWDIDYYRTIYPYHTVVVPNGEVQTGSSALLRHKRTCNMIKTCDECLQGVTQFRCFWCSKLQQCSDSFDRARQNWVYNGCPHNRTEDFIQTDCSHMFTTPAPTRRFTETTSKDSKVAEAVGAGIATFFLLMLLIALVVIIYGYRNPESFMGQWMIRNRPSELSRKFKVWRNPDRENADNMHAIS